jgi:hypothetical protein
LSDFDINSWLAGKRAQAPAKPEGFDINSWLASKRGAAAPASDQEPEDRIGRAAREYRENTEALGARPSSAKFPMPGYENLPREKPLIREDPIGTVIGATTGAKAGMIAAKPILNLATKSGLGGAVTGLAGSLLGYEASAVPMAAGSAAAVGENPLEAAKRTATDPVALATTGALGALGGAAQGHAAGIRDPHNLSGRVLQDVEAAGGKVGIGGPRGGLFEAPEFTELDKGRAGINALAGKSAERIAADNAERLTKAREAFGDAADHIIAEHGDRHVPTLNTHQALDSIDAENTVNGVIGNDKVASATAKLRQMLTTETGQLDAQASAAAGKPVMVTAPAVKAGDLIKTRKLVNRMLRQTQEPSEKHVFGQALNGLAEDAAAVDPRIGQMNAAFKQEMGQLSTVNEALFGQRRPELNGAMSASQQAAGRLGRVGDETQAGTLAQQRMQSAADASPQVQRELLLNRAKKAQERLRLSGDETSTSIEKGAGNAVHRGVKHAVGAAIGGMLGHTVGGPVGAAVGSAAGTAAAGLAANPLALKLRLGLPLADAAGRLAGRPAFTANRLVELARQRNEADAQAAARLMGQ